MTGIIDIEYGVPVCTRSKDQGWPDWVYEQTLFNMWAGLRSEDMQNRLINTIKSFGEEEIIEVVFDIRHARRDNMRSLCDMRTKVLLEFDKPEFDDDAVIVMVKRDELLKKINWIKKHFKAVEINGKQYDVWI